jgi:hypothetical protein
VLLSAASTGKGAGHLTQQEEKEGRKEGCLDFSRLLFALALLCCLFGFYLVFVLAHIMGNYSTDGGPS